MQVVGARSSDTAVQLQAGPAAKTLSIHPDRRSAKAQSARHVEREDTARRTIPGRRGQARSQRGAGVLGNKHDLIGALSLGCGQSCGRVAKYQASASSGTGDGNRTSTHRTCGIDELIISRIIDRGKSLTGAAVAISARIGSVDARILHLDHQEQAAGRNRARSRGCANRD